MRKFIINISIASCIIIPFLIFLEIKNRKNDSSELKIKSSFIKKNKHEIKGLIVGPSHIKRAINPQYIDINTASVAIGGSALNTDFLLFDKIQKKLNLTYVIFDLSNGYTEKLNSDDWISAKKLFYYFRVFDKKIKLKDFFIIKLPIWKDIISKKKEKKKKPTYNKYGFNLKMKNEKMLIKKCHYNDTLIMKSKLFQAKIKNHKRTDNKIRKTNILILNKILTICKQNNIKLIFINPPKYHLYNKYVINKQHEDLNIFLKENIDNHSVYYWNLSSFLQFRTKFFMDTSHLNADGATVFTKMINLRLNEFLSLKE